MLEAPLTPLRALGAPSPSLGVLQAPSVLSVDAPSPQNSLVVEIPPFRNLRISSPVQVSFYVCNGKRKRSQLQPYTYLPAHGEPACSAQPSSPARPCVQPLHRPSPLPCVQPSPLPCVQPNPLPCVQPPALYLAWPSPLSCIQVSSPSV